MGSDLSMSPPTPDEYRIVRAGSTTAVYARHTDAIYREGTDRWFRKHHIYDVAGAALEALRATHPGWKVTTLDDGAVLPESTPLEYLNPDRDYAAEVAALRSKATRARERALLAYEEAVTFEAQALALEKEAHSA